MVHSGASALFGRVVGDMFWSEIAVEENQSVIVRPGRKARQRGRDPGLQDMFLYAHAAKGETGSLNIDKSVCQRARDWKDWKKPMATGRGYRIWKGKHEGSPSMFSCCQ